ncbi:carboxylesterase [Setomelanomma holmii]|uniref:Carboxylesterase n=1 Tax=Setomelanomma holmii TaxID=210430 RepID=A0A9P4HHV7_9PLEO|nr:carboxylesterase [Setomelanomma holmii]
MAVHGTPQEQRAFFDAFGQTVAAQLPPSSKDVKVTDHDASGLRVRVYRSDAAPDKPLPIGIFAHGGGFVCGSLDSEDSLCRALAEHVHTVIVSVEYRLAPEHKAPAQLDDMLKGYKWAHDNAPSINGDPNKLYTIGGSAGGALSLMLARKIALGQSSLDPSAIKGVVAFVPMAFYPNNVPEQFKATHTSHDENATNVPLIDRHSVDTAYGYTGLDPNDKDYFVGLDTASHKLFPPTYIATCEFDPLRDDGKILAKLLQDAGASVRHDHYDGLPHCFWFVPSLPETGIFMQNTIAAMNWVIGQMSKVRNASGAAVSDF